jgi:hypothetical protein
VAVEAVDVRKSVTVPATPPPDLDWRD